MGYNNANYNCADDDCSSLSSYDETIQACGAAGRLGGAHTAYLLNCGEYITNPGSISEWDQKVADGKAIRISNIKFGMAAPANIEQDSTTSCGTKRVINRTWTANIEDYKVSPVNSYFWSNASKRTFEAMMFIECTTSGLTEVVSFVDDVINVAAYRDIPNTNEQLQKYVADISWKSIDAPIQYNVTA